MTLAPKTKRVVRAVLRVVLAVAMTWVGVLHFVDPAPFVRIVPAWLPAPAALVAVSGAAEIGLGLALLPEKTRKLAGWGLVALYLAVFPANVNMAIHHIQLHEGDALPVWAMWARLPFQALFIAWAWWVTRDEPAPNDGAVSPPRPPVRP
jgi:uncharacterized membrane protein